MEPENIEELLQAIDQLENHGQYYLSEEDLCALDSLIYFVRDKISSVQY